MRITTNMVMKNYQSGLYATLNTMEEKRSQVSTGRQFTDSYQDPFSAAQGSVLETRYARNQDYINAVENTQMWQDAQEDAVNEINEMAKEINKLYSVQALNDTNAAEREVFASTFRAMQESMISSLNGQFSDVYVLAGEDGENPPFDLLDDGTVTYRGLSLDDPSNAAVFEEMSKESAYIDLGFGLKFDAAGEVVPSTAFDSALPGINIVGFGHDADGTSQNLIVLAGKMADELEKDPFDRTEYEKLWNAFDNASNGVISTYTELGSQTKLLESTLTKLENEEVNIIEQMDSTINIDAAEAITNFSYAQYVYNAALKMGTNILSPSLLDYIQ